MKCPRQDAVTLWHRKEQLAHRKDQENYVNIGKLSSELRKRICFVHGAWSGAGRGGQNEESHEWVLGFEGSMWHRNVMRV